MLILHEHTKKRALEAAVFDFDGTLSKLRSGWESVMEPLMLEYIPGERAEVADMAHRYIDESTGIQTIFQMRWLAEKVAERGGAPLDPWEYKAEYNRRLMVEVGRRREAVAKGLDPREKYLVPGCEAFLAELKSRGVALYAASGTDDRDVKTEAAVLGLDRYFDEIAGAPEGSDRCSKEAVLLRLMRPGAELLVVGDGKVEIALGREAGALTLGIASREDGGSGMNQEKYRRLSAAGAHALASDFSEREEILEWI